MAAKIVKGPKSIFEKDRRSLGEFYFDAAKEHGNKICQVDPVTGQTETFSSVRTRSARAAVHLRKFGITPVDNVLFCSGNNLNNMIPVLASLYLGANVASLDPTLSVRDCAHGITMVKPKYVFVEEASVELMEKSLLQAKYKAEIFVIGQSQKYKQFADLMVPSEEEHSFRPVAVKDCHDTAFIYFSSGTTGLPKGVCVTHYGVLNGIKTLLSMDVINPDVIMHFTSLYWISAALLMTVSFVSGGSRILAPKFDTVDVYKWVEKYKITYILMAPIYTFYLTSVENHEKYDTSSLNVLAVGGTPVSPDQLLRTRQFFKHTIVTTAYGCTEATGYITCFDFTRDKHLINKAGSAGKCMVDSEIKIVDVDTREVLGPNRRGELLFKSPYQMKGYYNIDSAAHFDEHGFIKTGDIAYYDEDECFYIVDRLKEVFKFKSWHVSPAAIESVLQEHPAVIEAVVFGIPHEMDEYHPAACVVLKCRTSVDDIEKFVAERVSEWQKLRGGIKIVEFLEKTPSGKIQRRKMRDEFMKT